MKKATDNTAELTALELRLEILRSSYWEHFKFFNDKSTGMHVKLKPVESEIKKLTEEIEVIKTRIDKLRG